MRKGIPKDCNSGWYRAKSTACGLLCTLKKCRTTEIYLKYKTAQMGEGTHMEKLFRDWYNGNPWTYVKMTDILQDIDAEMAAKHWVPGANSIWQLVQHCLGWRENVLLKLQGRIFQSPEDNYLSEPEDTGTDAWNSLLEALQKNEQEWEAFLHGLDDGFLQAGYAPAQNEFTQYEVIHGILHHDNYHFGQILMLKKLAQAS